MKTIHFILAIALVILLNSCDSTGVWYVPPSGNVIDTLSQKDLERVDSSQIKIARATFSALCDSTKLVYGKDTFYQNLDLQSDFDREIAKEYSGELSVYQAEVKNDSIFVVTYYSPSLEKVTKGDVLAHERMYIFHKNGDVSIKLGNMVTNDGFDNSFIKVYVHESGKVLYYDKDDFGWDNSYRVTVDGQVRIGSEYGVLSGGRGIAKKTTEYLFTDVAEIQKKLSL